MPGRGVTIFSTQASPDWWTVGTYHSIVVSVPPPESGTVAVYMDGRLASPLVAQLPRGGVGAGGLNAGEGSVTWPVDFRTDTSYVVRTCAGGKHTLLDAQFYGTALSAAAVAAMIGSGTNPPPPPAQSPPPVVAPVQQVGGGARPPYPPSSNQ